MAAYHWGGIYVATGVLMASMVLLVAVDYLQQRKISAMHALSTALVLIFGTLTLVLHDPRFLKWKPSILLWLMALIFMGSRWVGAKSLSQRMFEPTLPEGFQVARADWHRVNWLMVGAYLLLGAINLLVARNASEQNWVYFKGFGLTLALAALAVGAALWLQTRKVSA